MPVTGVGLGSAVGEALGSVEGEAGEGLEGSGVIVPPPGGNAVGRGVDGTALVQADSATSRARRIGRRGLGRIGLVGVEADVGGLDRRHGAVVEKA